ncbi:MAG: type II toxin-antitoxin system VapC family toxin [Chloroflexota bacterium]|nr:type II toxin-antitoxin system VapC family toxin [Chloroflexota bacterium]
METPAAKPNSPTVVLDSSALLAFLQREPGSARVRFALIEGAAICSVNLAEVYGKWVATGRLVTAAIEYLYDSKLTVLPFTEEDALLAANLVLDVRPITLSLGDRACLATGMRLALPILTGDRVWANLQIGAEIELFRS